MQRAWTIAFRNLRRSRRRNFATVCAIAFGYAGLVVLGGYATRVERFLRANSVYLQHTGHVTVWLEGGFDKASAEPDRFQLDPAAHKAVLDWAARDTRVDFAAAYLRAYGLAGNGCITLPARLLGVEPRTMLRIADHPQVKAWSPEIAAPVSGAWIGAEREVVRPVALSVGLAMLLGKTRVRSQAVGLPPAPAVLHCDTPLEAEELARDADVQLASMTYDGTLNALDTEMVATFHTTEAYSEDGSIIT